MKAIFILLVLSVALSAQTTGLPDAPKPKPQAKTAFFSFRTSFNNPLNKPNKRSWTFFLASNLSMWGFYAYDHHVTHGIREAASSELPAIGAVTAMDFMFFKFFSPAMSVEAPIYADQHYLRDALR